MYRHDSPPILLHWEARPASRTLPLRTRADGGRCASWSILEGWCGPGYSSFHPLRQVKARVGLRLGGARPVGCGKTSGYTPLPSGPAIRSTFPSAIRVPPAAPPDRALRCLSAAGCAHGGRLPRGGQGVRVLRRLARRIPGGSDGQGPHPAGGEGGVGLVVRGTPAKALEIAAQRRSLRRTHDPAKGSGNSRCSAWRAGDISVAEAQGSSRGSAITVRGRSATGAAHHTSGSSSRGARVISGGPRARNGGTRGTQRGPRDCRTPRRDGGPQGGREGIAIFGRRW